ncbi:MAG: hypothetical protein QW666_00860 [Candidatus Woesearchaeota archaeon]
MPSILSNVVLFFEKIGIYDVVLPFLLTFTIVFAILEKTRVLGVEKIGTGKEKEEYSRKNLNAMVAFVIGFLVIASARLVEAITRVSAQVVVLLLLSVFFLMLVGTFFKKEEEVALEKGFWRYLFMIIMFVGIVFIFLDAIKTEAGVSWLMIFIYWLRSFWTSTAVASIILIIGIIAFMWFIVWGPKAPETPSPKKTEKEKKEGET